MSYKCALLLALTAAALAAAQPATTGVQDSPSGAGGQGVPGAQCATFVVFTAPDGCSSCSCSVDARMTDCTRSTCSDPGNYTINECVENQLYLGSDGCNRCQCNAFRSFSWCTRNICLLSEASSPKDLLVASPSPRPSSRSPPLRPSRPPPRRTASPTYTPDYGTLKPPTRRRGWTRRPPAGSSTTPDGGASTRGRD